MSIDRVSNDLREEALSILKNIFNEKIADETEIYDKDSVNSELIEEIFYQAWENQFSDDSSKFKKAVRKSIRDMAKSEDENQ